VVVAAAAVLLVVLGGAGMAANRTGLLTRAADGMPWSAPRPGCSATDVSVLVAPEIAPVAQQVLTGLAGRTLPDGTCLRLDIEAQDPAETTANAAMTATVDLPQVWIPDSSLWLGLTSAWPIRPVGSLATSPVVLATSPKSLQQLGWNGREVTWPQGLATTHALVAPSVTDDASALLSLLALAQTLGPGIATQQQIAAIVLATSRQPARDVSSALDLIRAGNTTLPDPVFITSQQTVTDANKDGAGGLVAVRPVGVPTQLDFPILRVGRPSDDPVVSAGADLVVEALTAPAARQAAASAGFGPPSPTVVPRSEAERAAQQAAVARVSGFVTQLRTLSIPTRLLTVVDVSLSMAAPAAQPRLSRIALAAQAALTVGPLLPDGSAIGLWSFAGRQDDGRTYREIARMDYLGAPDHVVPGDHDKTHRDAVERDLRLLPRQLSSGGTALYDTALAALRQARDTFDSQANNAVVLFTDGANDYDRGITLRQFLAAARSEARAHPDQVIPLFAIAIGPQADMASLKAMCDATGGRAYRADTAASVKTDLFDAIAHRPIRQS
jgi:Ca-activated chloride channel homolog